jgi:hypothetical protein
MAVNAQGKDPVFVDPVVSEGDPPNKPPKERDKWTETVWMEDPPPGSWSHSGPSIGTVQIEALGPPGSPNFRAHFDFGVDVEGKVPGGDRWQGKGKGKAKGPKPDKDVDIEFRNPKRWG